MLLETDEKIMEIKSDCCGCDTEVEFSLSNKETPLSGAALEPVKLLIVDDSRMLRKAIRKIFDNDDQIEVVGEAANGVEALEMIPQLQPDVVTLDVNMPVMDGILTLKHIMIKYNIPTVMLSSLTKEGAEKTFDALRFGAIDFITKPSKLSDDVQVQQQGIVDKVKLVANVRMKNVRRFRKVEALANLCEPASEVKRCVVFGASEGGYGTLLKVIPKLKPDWPATYIVVLYAESGYVDAFSAYLDRNSQVRVKRAVDNETLLPGTCYLAAGSEYITVEDFHQDLVLSVNPSPFPARRGAIDILMLSLSEILSDRTVGVILTGQEQDGAEGVSEIARVGGDVIIQDPQTCLFREMAQTAINFCDTGKILPDINIADAIETFFTKP